MQSRTTTFDGDAGLVWQPVRVRKTRKGRASASRGTVQVEIPLATATPARRPGGIRPQMGDALELALFVATLAAIAFLHLGAFALVW